MSEPGDDGVMTRDKPQPEIKGTAAAAILLMMLDDDGAAQVLTHLDPSEVQMLGKAMFEVANVREDQIETVLTLFLQRARECTTLGFGVAPRIRSVMQQAFGPDRANTMLARITPQTRSSALEMLQWMDAKAIGSLIEHEHPQIAALVLAHLGGPVAADVLQLLPEAMQVDAIARVARLDSVTSEALEDLERLLFYQFAIVSSAPASARGGLGEAAKIMNNTRPGHDKKILALLREVSPELAQGVQDEMFIFDDLAGLDQKNMGILMRAVENDTLVVALKGASETMREQMLGCISSRAADTIRDEMAERSGVRLAEVLEAQKAMVTIARSMADAGTLILAGRGDDYV